jgi:hypothetical protein
MTTSSTIADSELSAEKQQEMRKQRLARMAERFDEVDRRLAELEAKLEKAEEEFRPKQPR